ncbi:hypothetical protein BC350_04790 [Ralstonia pseudosolanacearum]|nr:hypothetical protein BC350_04790 [Ralstonia pseudosolanacearum]
MDGFGSNKHKAEGLGWIPRFTADANRHLQAVQMYFPTAYGVLQQGCRWFRLSRHQIKEFLPTVGTQ